MELWKGDQSEALHELNDASYDASYYASYTRYLQEIVQMHSRRTQMVERSAKEHLNKRF